MSDEVNIGPLRMRVAERNPRHVRVRVWDHPPGYETGGSSGVLVLDASSWDALVAAHRPPSQEPVVHTVHAPAIVSIQVRADGTIASLDVGVAWSGLVCDGPHSLARHGASVERYPDGEPIGQGADHPLIGAASDASWSDAPVTWEAM